MSDDDRSHSADGTAAAWLAGGGEMGERIRALDWASTPLGPTSSWPQSLRSAISILLPSKAQICMFWGPELVKLYNDAYIPVLGAQASGCVLGLPGARGTGPRSGTSSARSSTASSRRVRRSGPTITPST